MFSITISHKRVKSQENIVENENKNQIPNNNKEPTKLVIKM
ncbi:MAG TPA: hypothetical protein IAB56_07375 [Candidatus Scybalousia intestinigallinarum]|nr:hypothetical protein [Candidatus Scybalousia intestinigallinarum]